jgi:anti-sigma B factor antagonist
MTESVSPFSLEEATHPTPSGPIRVIAVEGELDMTSVSQLEEMLASRSWQEVPGAVFDLRRCGFMDSSGIRALVFAGQDIESAGGQWALVLQPGSPIRNLLALTELEDRMSIHPSVEGAIAAVSASGDGLEPT